MNGSDCNIEIQVDRAGEDGSAVRRVAIAVSETCFIDVAPHEGKVVLRLSTAGNRVCLTTEGPHSDFVRAVNLLRLHLPRCCD